MWDPSNYQTLCQRCHSLKTMEEQRTAHHAGKARQEPNPLPSVNEAPRVRDVKELERLLEVSVKAERKGRGVQKSDVLDAAPPSGAVCTLIGSPAGASLLNGFALCITAITAVGCAVAIACGSGATASVRDSLGDLDIKAHQRER
jgi:hypothetical protein